MSGLMEVAGLIPTATRTAKGMLSPGIRCYSGSKTLDQGESFILPFKVAGLLFVKNGYSWSGYNMYYVYRSDINLLSTTSGTNPVGSINASNGIVTINNNTSGQRVYRYYIINISVPEDTAEDIVE